MSLLRQAYESRQDRYGKPVNMEWYPEDKESFLEKAENSITIKNTYQFERPAAWLCFHCHKLVMDVPERANFRFTED